MKKKQSCQVKLMIQFPFECQVEAKNEDEAVDMALDNAMDYMEDETSGHQFDEFWEYTIDYKLLSMEKDTD